MVGIPDGLGAFGGPKGQDFGLIMNQELRGTQGVDRRHGVNGAFDSVWRIDPKTLEVEEGADLIDPTVRYWDYGSDSYTDTATAPFTQQFNRFCSGYLAAPGQLFNEKTGRGYDGQLYFANEENGDIGRLFGHGNPFDRAGLTNGHNFVVDMADEAVSSDTQFRATYGKNNPARFDLGSEEEVDWNQPGADQNAESKEDGLALNRIEDGAFDPRHPEDFYFVTTAGGNGATSDRDGGGIWRLSYDDVERPWEGGTLTLLLDGSESDPALWNPDNVGFDKKGHLLIQEDPGNNPHRAKIVAYDVDSGDVATLAEFDNRFEPGSATFITQDEESSGIINASRYLGSNTFLFDAQIHLAHPDAGKVEHGQLMTLHVQSWKKMFAGD